MREIVRASAWGGFRELVEELGGNADEIFAAAHVDVAALADPERYMPLRELIDSQEIAAQRLGRRDFGLIFGGRQNLSVLGALSIAIVNSATTRHGIEVCARYLHVHNPALSMELAPMARSTRDFLGFTLSMRRPGRHQQNSERILASVHKVLGQLGGDPYKAREVWFPHAAISPMSIYRQVFGVTPLFEKPAMGIAIERSVLDRWRPGGSSELRHIAETYLRSLSPPRGNSFTIRVSTMTRNLLRTGECTPEQTAKALGVHARTLQRRLQAEGATFEKIKDDVRREWAESLLGQPSVSLSQIAMMLGYADSSAFSRSCRRWFGEAPRNHRTRLVAARTTGAPAGPRPSRVNSLAATLRARSRLAST